MSFLASNNPLPIIDDPAIAQRIFLHKSLGKAPLWTADGPLEDDNERLAFLGDQVLTMCITDILFKKCPTDKVGSLSPRRTWFINKGQVALWSAEYDLPGRIQGPEHQLLTIQTNKLQRAQVFQAYIAAMFLQDGYPRTRNWMEPVIEAAYETMLTQTESSDVEQLLDDLTVDDDNGTPSPQQTGLPSPAGSPRPSAPPGTPRSPPPSSRAGPSSTSRSPPPSSRAGSSSAPPTPQRAPSNALSQFNERCAQSKLEIDWTEQTQGLAHQPTFTMSVKVQGFHEVLGRGTAPNKKAAQQLAADAALKKLQRVIDHMNNQRHG